MITFLIGFAILLVGGALYGKVCEKVFKPDDRETPAVRLNDGMDYVPMKKWKNALIQLLNIAGTGPILGPIQGILFGPIAFLTIPIGCILGGAFHDYMCGMISVRNEGAQMPSLIRKYLGKYAYTIYNVFVCILMLLVGTVFIYTPGDLFITQILNADSGVANPIVWIVYGVIFLYYIIATLFPIDKIIGKIYPIFGMLLVISAVGVFVGLFVKGYPLERGSYDLLQYDDRRRRDRHDLGSRRDGRYESRIGYSRDKRHRCCRYHRQGFTRPCRRHYSRHRHYRTSDHLRRYGASLASAYHCGRDENRPVEKSKPTRHFDGDICVCSRDFGVRKNECGRIRHTLALLCMGKSDDCRICVCHDYDLYDAA